uniref:Uncharacterized protein n=1 Tax=Romanomermis culicivorax TaxID=13658 RepID=A0A915JMW2_ROMCU
MATKDIIALCGGIFIIVLCLIIILICMVCRYKLSQKRADASYKTGYPNNSMMMRHFAPGQHFQAEFNPNYEMFNGMDCSTSQDLREVPRSCVTMIK